MTTHEIEPSGSAVDPTGFLLEGNNSVLPIGVSYQIRDVDNLWQLIGEGTAKYPTARSGFVHLGPELGNLGAAPSVRFVDNHLCVKLDMQKPGGANFYQAIPDAALQKRINHVSPNLKVDGVNIYLISQEGRERIAYKNTNHEFVYDPVTRVVTGAKELQWHLELAARLYKAYITAYYEENNLELPSDILIFDGYFLTREETAITQNTTRSVSKSGEELEGIVVSDRPGVTFEDIGGQAKAVETCRRFAEQLRYPAVYALQGSVPPRGILLWGPPGTGKTLLAKAIAKEAEAHFLHIDASDIAGEGLYGQSERAVKGVFGLARKLSEKDGKQAIIFVDEGDLLLPRSGGRGQIHEATGKTISIFAQEMDGLVSSPKITVIISTNEPQSLDARILSRMEESEEVAMPDQEGLLQILRIHLSRFSQKAGREIFNPNLDLGALSEKCYKQGLSGRDIADVVSLIARRRGQRQLVIIKEAITQGRLQIPLGEEDAEYINHIARRLSVQDAQGLEGLVLASATTEEIGEIVDHAKELLKNKPDKRMGFIRN